MASASPKTIQDELVESASIMVNGDGTFNVSSMSTLEPSDLKRLRGVLMQGVQFMLHLIKGEIEKDEMGKFEDLELAVSTENLTSSKCGDALKTNQVVYFVRLTEKFTSMHDERTPRVLQFGVVMSLTNNPSCPVACELWDMYKPQWQGKEDALARSTQKALEGFTSFLMRAVWAACKSDAASTRSAVAEVDDEE